MKTPKHIVTAINTAIEADSQWRDKLRGAADVEELRSQLDTLEGQPLAQAIQQISIHDAVAEKRIEQAFDHRAELLRILSRALRDWRSELAQGIEARWQKAAEKWCSNAGLPAAAVALYKHSTEAKGLIDELRAVAGIPLLDVGRDGYCNWRTESIRLDRVERAAVSDPTMPSRDGGQAGDDSNLQEVLTNLV